MPDSLRQVALVAVESALVVFYWSHCAEPALRFAGALPRTMRIVSGLGVGSVAVFVASSALQIDGQRVPLILWILTIVPGLLVFGGMAETRARRAHIRRSRQS